MPRGRKNINKRYEGTNKAGERLIAFFDKPERLWKTNNVSDSLFSGLGLANVIELKEAK